MKDNKCKCENCEFLNRHFVDRYHCKDFCMHPNQDYIRKYFTEKGLKKKPPLIGSLKPNEHKNRRTPKWCPLNREAKE